MCISLLAAHTVEAVSKNVITCGQSAYIAERYEWSQLICNMCCWVKAILWTCCMLYLPLSSIPFLPLLSNNGEKSQMLRVFSLSFSLSLSLSLYVSHSTLLPLYLSTPECNQFSVGVGELMRGRRVQGLNEYGDHTWAAAHLIAVFSPQAGLVLTLHACLGAGVFFFFSLLG